MKNKSFQFKPTEVFLWVILITLFTSCKNNPIKDNESYNRISENDFIKPPSSVKPWVYYWWLKGNVTKELITRDLEEMQKKGIGGFLLVDSRGYWDDFYGSTGHIPVPLEIKHEFMSPSWREMVKFTMKEANRLGLKMSINIANTGGSLRGSWDMKDEGPKQLIWTASSVKGPSNVSFKLEKPLDKKYFQDVALKAVRINSKDYFGERNYNGDINSDWITVSAPEEKSPVVDETIDLTSHIINGNLNWTVPEGEWRILRFGYHVIDEEGSVDILNSESVTKYFHLMGSEILKDAGELAGVTLTHFYNVSWEGGQPDWTVNFKNEFEKYRGYDISQYMPILAGMIVENYSVSERFMRDYLKTISDCFKKNCYETIGKLCHDNGIQWHSENGGPWPRNAPMFKEADMLAFWGINDMPQGEFWCNNINDLHRRSNVKFTANAAHIYGRPIVSVEAFTHMTNHWTMYPAYLKPFADINFIDGANFFVWHTFTASPLEVGKPGFEYFAGTHLNPNVTWWNKVGNFMDYLGRCQYLLREGHYVADICCYVSDKNYVAWGRGEIWNEKSSLSPVEGFSYDLLSSEVLVEQLTVKNGNLVLPDGMSYKMLVVDLDEPLIKTEVLKKIIELANDGATVILGQIKPSQTPGISNYPECDKEIIQMADELWTNNDIEMQARKLGNGKIYSGGNMEEILSHNNELADFEGPFEYIHRRKGNMDIYFVSGEGIADCTFRIERKKPEIWDPVTGQITDAISHRFTNDGRTTVSLNLPENGSTFIVFREKAEKFYFTSVTGPKKPDLAEKAEKSSDFIFWENGSYTFTSSSGKSNNIQVNVNSPLELTGFWNVIFEPATEAEHRESTFQELVFWNEHLDNEIKYFSGTATYTKTFNLTAEQVKNPSRIHLNEIYNIARIWINGKDLGVIWTNPWSVTISDVVKEGTNELKIEVTNCWANRLIGDAALPENERTAKTNVRLVPDRTEFKRGHQATSAIDQLMPSGLLGPVIIEFGKYETVSL